MQFDEVVDDNVLPLVFAHLDTVSLIVCRFVAHRWSDTERRTRPSRIPSGAIPHDCKRRRCRQECAFHVVSRSPFSVIRWAATAGLFSVRDDFAVIAAAMHGRIDVLDWLADGCGNVRLFFRPFEEAAIGGHVAVLDWMRDRGHDFMRGSEYGMSEYAARKLWIHVAKARRLDVLVWLHAHGASIPLDDVHREATMNGATELLDWVHALGHRPDSATLNTVIYFYREERAAIELPVIGWLLEHGCVPVMSACIVAVRRCALDVIKLLHPYASADDHARWLQEARTYRCDRVAAWLSECAPPLPSGIVSERPNRDIGA